MLVLKVKQKIEFSVYVHLKHIKTEKNCDFTLIFYASKSLTSQLLLQSNVYVHLLGDVQIARIKRLIMFYQTE